MGPVRAKVPPPSLTLVRVICHYLVSIPGRRDTAPRSSKEHEDLRGEDKQACV